MHTSSAAGPTVGTPGPSVSRFFVRSVVILTLVGLVLRLTRLGAQSLWIDECLSIGWIHSIERDGFGVLLHNIHGPLHAVAIWLSSRVSMSEWWLRFPSVVAGTLAIPALAGLGRAWWGERVGLTAACLLAVSPFALYYAQECRNYSFTVLFASLTLWAAWNLARQPSVRTAVLFLVAEFLGIASNLNGVFLALGLNLWLLWAWRRRVRWVGVWVGLHLLMALPFTPYLRQVQQQVRIERLFGVETDFGESHRLRGETTLHPMALPYSAFAFAAGYSLGPTLEELRRDPSAAARPRHLPALFLVLMGFGVPLVAGAVQRRDARPLVPALFAVVCVAGVTMWLAATNMKPFNVRYLSVLLPVFLLVVSRGLWGLPRRLGQGAALAALAVGVWSCGNYLFVPRYARDDTRGVVAYLREHSAPDDLVVHINLILPMRYYAGGLAPPVLNARPGSGDSQEAARRYVEELLSRGADVLWYVECRPEAADPHGYLRRALDSAAREAEVRRFPGIRLYRFDLPS